MQGILPGEQVLEHEQTVFKKEVGILQITNARLLWRRTGDPLYQVNTSRLNIGGNIQIVKDTEQSTDKNPVYVARIEINGKPNYFRFTGADGELKANNIKSRLEETPSENQIAQNSLDSDSLLKIIQLKDSQELKDLF